MEAVLHHPLMQVSKEEMISISQSYNLDREKIQENSDVIIEWWKKQDHLVDALPFIERPLVERLLLLGRGSIERTKGMIDRILTTRTLLPELVVFQSVEEFETLFNSVLYTIVPKLNPKDNTRIVVLKLSNENVDTWDLLTIFKFGFFMADVRSRHDYSFEDRHILDMKYFKANMITQVNPVHLKKAEYLCTETFKVKIKGIHIVNAPPFVHLLIRIMKQIFKEKIANRIHVHSTYEELYQEIHKEALPEDYGGDQPSCQTLVDEWKKYFKTEEAKTIIENSSKLVVNESRRSSFKFNEEYLGVPGSFKQLNVD